MLHELVLCSDDILLDQRAFPYSIRKAVLLEMCMVAHRRESLLQYGRVWEKRKAMSKYGRVFKEIESIL